MRFGVSILSIVPMRSEPSDLSEMVNQILLANNIKFSNKERNFLELGYLMINMKDVDM